MKVFIDIGHPAHVHYFKNLIKILQSSNTSFVITSRNKEMAHYLLNKNNISFIDRGKGSDTVFGKLLYMLKANFNILKIALKTKPDLFISFGAPYVAQVSFLLNLPSITIDDTENAKLGQLFYRYFTDLILTPNTFYRSFGGKQHSFNGYMELAYLNPKYFSPDLSVLDDLNIQENETFIILRFVKWKAHHDIGHNGISNKNKILLVNKLLSFGKVFISSETALPNELIQYKLNISPEKIHSVLFYSSLFYGESATMASESAVLGTPAIYIDNDGRGYTDEQEKKYGLVYNFTESISDQKKSVKKALEILENNDKKIWQEKRKKMLDEKIDVTAFLIEEINKFKK